MAFVFKDKDGKIKGTSAVRNSDDQLRVKDDDPELIEFEKRVAAGPTVDNIYDKTIKENKVIKAIVKTLNDAGSFSSSGDTLSGADLKDLIKSNM